MRRIAEEWRDRTSDAKKERERRSELDGDVRFLFLPRRCCCFKLPSLGIRPGRPEKKPKTGDVAKKEVAGREGAEEDIQGEDSMDIGDAKYYFHRCYQIINRSRDIHLRDPLQWSVEDVAKWAVGTVHLDNHDAGLLKRHKIDGEALSTMNYEDFRECEIDIGPAKKLIKFMKKLFAERDHVDFDDDAVSPPGAFSLQFSSSSSSSCNSKTLHRMRGIRII